MDQHPVEHPVRHRCQPVGDSDLGIGRSARTPPRELAIRPLDRRRHREVVAAGQLSSPGGKVDRSRGEPPGRSGDHRLDEPRLLFTGQSGRDENTYAAIDHVSLDGPLAPFASDYFDGKIAHRGIVRTAADRFGISS